MIPFNYPPETNVRIHGPSGYQNYERYRDWLRDEFLFRCVYCLQREQWGLLKGGYHIDHFCPKAIYPELTLDYDNLLYCCSTCNLAKGDAEIPNPEWEFTEPTVDVYENGAIKGHTPEARKIIRVLGLDSPEYVEYRLKLIGIIELTAASNVDLYNDLMRYPQQLPNLETKKAPANSKPDGINQSCFALRSRGELPDVYV